MTTSRRLALDAATAVLSASGIDTARVDAEWLLADALGMPRLALHLEAARALDAAEHARFESAVRRRARREPLQRILGWEEFDGLRLAVPPGVLIPRPETETLAAWAAEILPARRPPTPPLAIDLGTGSGCIACALATRRPAARVVAIDCSETAARVARDNVRALGLGERVAVVAGDLLSAVRGVTVDLVVSNPPYLPTALLDGLPAEVREHDPRLALDGGPDGLAVSRAIVPGARRRLRAGGVLVMETAGGGHIGAVAALMAGAGFRDVEVRADLNGVERFVAGRA
jgi:release factor glutamine methyltransferase